MTSDIALTNNGVRLIGKAAAVVELTLNERPMPLAETINIPPRGRTAE